MARPRRPLPPDRVPVGAVRRAHGVRGQVVVHPLTDHPDRFASGAVFLTDEDVPRRLEVVASQPYQDGWLVGFAEITDRDAAAALTGVRLTIAVEERRPLGEDEFWPDQLVGLAVVDGHGMSIGTIRDVVVGAAQDRLVIERADGARAEAPFVEPIVGEVDLDAGTVTVSLPPGLFEDEEPAEAG